VPAALVEMAPPSPVIVPVAVGVDVSKLNAVSVAGTEKRVPKSVIWPFWQ